ncbi:unnamed protein product, partial [Leptidea sinapis]
TEGISGFTRSLILRLVLSGERTTVSVRWAPPSPVTSPVASNVTSPVSSPVTSPTVAPDTWTAPPHAGHPAARGVTLLTLPAHTTIKTLLAEHRPPLPVMEEELKLSTSNSSASTSGSVLRSASDTAIMAVAEAWELSLAAASASKDKRVKDVKNALKQQMNKKRQSKASTDVATTSIFEESTEKILVQAAGISEYIPSSVTLGELSECAAGPQLALTLRARRAETS